MISCRDSTDQQSLARVVSENATFGDARTRDAVLAERPSLSLRVREVTASQTNREFPKQYRRRPVWMKCSGGERGCCDHLPGPCEASITLTDVELSLVRASETALPS